MLNFDVESVTVLISHDSEDKVYIHTNIPSYWNKEKDTVTLYTDIPEGKGQEFVEKYITDDLQKIRLLFDR